MSVPLLSFLSFHLGLPAPEYELVWENITRKANHFSPYHFQVNVVLFLSTMMACVKMTTVYRRLFAEMSFEFTPFFLSQRNSY